ncbi:MAG: acyl-CoA reductase [Bacteroidales bacterium]|nr:acyl-CoA reductase [Bacteroidales bacterium]
MELNDRIESIIGLGELLRGYQKNPDNPQYKLIDEASRQAFVENPWFTPDHIQYALKAWGDSLQQNQLEQWLNPYLQDLLIQKKSKTVGLIMAGNIPVVGLHDFLTVLISGHRVCAKLSSSDQRLIPALTTMLINIQPGWKEQIEFINGKLNNFDTIIATGSNNTSRYFEYYFGKYPHIIRKGRNSIAVLTGEEDGFTLRGLASDIMLYFGMGCRSVSKIYVPKGYDFSKLEQALVPFARYANHNKYFNNYTYYKTVLMLNNTPFIDNGFLSLVENSDLASPVSLLHYQFYNQVEEIIPQISRMKDSIQCIVSTLSMPFPTVLPGMAQTPALWDYADGKDTMKFLLS